MYRTELKLISSAFLLVGILASCTDKRHDCVARADCPALSSIADGGTEAGSTEAGGATTVQSSTSDAQSGLGGGSSIGGVGGTASTASLPPTAGAPASTTSVPLPCDGKCAGETPVCDAESNSCVECTDAQRHCPRAAPICSPKHVCVECENSDSCKALGKVCDTAPDSASVNTCVECVTNTDCTSPERSRCDVATHACVACAGENSTDCSHIPSATVCLPGKSPELNRCVQCTGKNFTACPKLNGEQLVCDSEKSLCAADRIVGKAKSCEPCVSDAECQAGLACHQQIFNGKVIGNFCFMKQGSTPTDATTNCKDAANRPYFRVIENAVSVDGIVSDICGLNSSTCPAWIAYRFNTTLCGLNGVPKDEECEHAGSKDAKCVAFSPTEYRCAPRCTFAEDCPNPNTEVGNLCQAAPNDTSGVETTCRWP